MEYKEAVKALRDAIARGVDDNGLARYIVEAFDAIKDEDSQG